MLIINKNYLIKNIATLSMTVSSILFFIFYYFIDWELLIFKSEKFSFFKDPIFYVALLVNLIVQLTSRSFNKFNEKNIRFIQFSTFLTISIIPIFSFIFSLIFIQYKNNIDVNYSNPFEPFVLSLTLIVLSFLIFKDKYQNRTLKRLDLMFLTTITSSISAVLFVKLMQEYDSIAFYACTMAFNSLFFIILLVKNKEYSKVDTKGLLKVIPVGAILYLSYSYLNIYAVNHLPVEVLSILRTLFGVLLALLFDKYHDKPNIFNTKDLFLLFLIFLSLYFFKFN
jgi:hypothetical protein